MQDTKKKVRVVMGLFILMTLSMLVCACLGMVNYSSKMSEDEGKKLLDDSIYTEDEYYNLVRYVTYTYDQFGNVRSRYTYNGDGSLFSYEESRYATTGDWLQRVTGSAYGAGRTQEDRHLYASDIEGETRIVKAEYYENGILENVTYNYFYDGKVAKLTAWLNETGDIESYSGRIYMDTEEEETVAQFAYEGDKTLKNFLYCKLDDENRLLEKYKGSGSDDTVFSEKTIVTYDDSNHSNRQISYYPINHLNSYQDDVYSVDGKLLSSMEYLHGLNGGSVEDPMADMRIAKGHWAEYDKERLVWEMGSSWEELVDYDLCRYDENGNLSLEFIYDGADGTSRRLFRYVYDEEHMLKEVYVYSMAKEMEEFSLTDNNGIRYVIHFDAEYGTIKTISSYYPEGNMKEQYSFLKKDWTQDNKMLWHDVYYYKSSLVNKNKAYETTVYRYDIEGNLMEILDGSAL